MQDLSPVAAIVNGGDRKKRKEKQMATKKHDEH